MVEGNRVLEVGSLDVNGTVRPHVEALSPASYLGVDITTGPGVDELCRVEGLVDRYGSDRFGVVIATELVEHVEDWRIAFDNLKRVLCSEGVLLLTTRARGFHVHGFPRDYWRYELQDIRAILSDFDIVALQADKSAPGVFVLARKPMNWQPQTLAPIQLYSVVTRRRVHTVSAMQKWAFLARHFIFGRGSPPHRMYRKLVPEQARAQIKQGVSRIKNS